PAGVGLEVTLVPAAAHAPVLPHHDRVSDLAGVAGGPPAELAVEDETAADACTDPDAQNVRRSPAGAPLVLGQGAHVGIVVDEHGHAAERLADQIAERDVGLLPAGQVGRLFDDARLVVDRPGGADADAFDAPGAAEVVDHAGDRLDNGGRTTLGGGLPFGVALELLVLDDDAIDLGPPKVDPDPRHRVGRLRDQAAEVV